ncbi:tRNA pseudouridine synthase C [Tenacibaculum sp. MAR_2010_89]|uniref:pseudouridine synthase n=1 Tax=Tenacibaculum sp. MAR_2010_89 TaxID=1250198 RepID=UPI000895B13A|nr:pseudouridine synthase [Tenacibaculum sp. MAR_2010_89]SEE48326.1 tRNA pseudouridine synthase C [Tenacibaculum sp. MAR_2010_89]
MKLEVIYQDEYIVCVTKPNNVVVHHAHHSRNVSDEKSLLQLLDEQIKGKYYPIHRLDRKTSGIILLAKETKFVSKFQNLFTESLIQKTYYGIVRGHSPQSTIIYSPVKGRDSNVYKEAETKLETIKQKILDIPVKPYDTSRYSLVKLTPKTGRLHQLRIHTNKISHPLIGDPKYGDKNHNMMFIENFDCDNLFLHAHNLEFIHPFLNKEIKLTSNFTENWKVIFDKFNWEI